MTNQDRAPFDMLAHLARQRAFSEKTFGPGVRTKGVVDHIRKELIEIEAAPTDITEWIDVVILALDGAWRAGASPEQIVNTMVAKQTKNEGRNWPDWRTAPADKAIEHVRAPASGEAPQEVPNEPFSEESALQSQAQAWFAVVAALNKACPDWMTPNVAAIESAPAAILRLAQSAQAEAVKDLTYHPGGSGWKLVPIEPTKEMVRACMDNAVGGLVTPEYRTAIYRAMLDAAPSADVPAVAGAAEPAEVMDVMCRLYSACKLLIARRPVRDLDETFVAAQRLIDQTEAHPKPAAPIEAVHKPWCDLYSSMCGLPCSCQTQDVSDEEIRKVAASIYGYTSTDNLRIVQYARAILALRRPAHPVGAAPVEEPKAGVIWMCPGCDEPDGLPPCGPDCAQHDRPAAPVRAVEQQPAFYLSSKQLPLLGTEKAKYYFTYRMRAEGNFDTPVYFAAPKEEQPIAKIVQNDAHQISMQTPDGGPFDMSKHVGASLYLAAPKEEPAVLTQGKGDGNG